jgi:hypothetical protein
MLNTEHGRTKMNDLNRFERVAKEITQRHGVHVEWAPANREYVVEGRPAGTARKADQIARDVAHAANNYGVLGGISR